MTRDLVQIVAGARIGRTRDVARLLSLIEDGNPSVAALLAETAGDTPSARIVGITGSPGVGKSTLTSALVGVLRARGERVGVLAIDPSSPFSGGALLGDRIRMHEHATDEGVFIRSMASRGRLGGLAAAVPQAIRALDVAGFTTILLETVGVGQSEIDVAAAADTCLVLLAPGMGDGIQAAKAGILEVADILVVNKADRDGVEATVREVRSMIALSGSGADAWTSPVLSTVATTGDGIDVLCDAISDHERWLAVSGEGEARRLRRSRDEIEALALAALRSRLETGTGRERLDHLACEVLEGTTDAYAAAAALVDGL